MIASRFILNQTLYSLSKYKPSTHNISKKPLYNIFKLQEKRYYQLGSPKSISILPDKVDLTLTQDIPNSKIIITLVLIIK